MKPITDSPSFLRSDGTLSTLPVLGVRIHMVNMEQTVTALRQMLFDLGQHTIAPVNPEMIIAARKNMAFRDILNRTSLSLPDGTGIKLAARLYGYSHTERVAGIDTIDHLAGIAVKNNLSMYLLGAAPGIAGRAGTRLQERHPGLRIAGTYAGSPHPDEEQEICKRISASGADILLIAYGAPKQELWLSRNIRNLPVRVAMCVGGSFDFLAGVTSRAPRWMQRAGLEWLFRLIQEPSRWRRMLALPEFAVLVIVERIKSLILPKHS